MQGHCTWWTAAAKSKEHLVEQVVIRALDGQSQSTLPTAFLFGCTVKRESGPYLCQASKTIAELRVAPYSGTLCVWLYEMRSASALGACVPPMRAMVCGILCVPFWMLCGTWASNVCV